VYQRVGLIPAEGKTKHLLVKNISLRTVGFNAQTFLWKLFITAWYSSESSGEDTLYGCPFGLNRTITHLLTIKLIGLVGLWCLMPFSTIFQWWSVLLVEETTDLSQVTEKLYQWLAIGRWFSLGTPVSSTGFFSRHPS
jgi:hypothetical protein